MLKFTVYIRGNKLSQKSLFLLRVTMSPRLGAVSHQLYLTEERNEKDLANNTQQLPVTTENQPCEISHYLQDRI